MLQEPPNHFGHTEKREILPGLLQTKDIKRETSIFCSDKKEILVSYAQAKQNARCTTVSENDILDININYNETESGVNTFHGGSLFKF